jgi:hypothetical protein
MCALVVSQCSAAYLACYSTLVFLSALVLSQCSRLCSCVPVGHYKWFLVQRNELSLSQMCNTKDLDLCVLTCELVTGRSALLWDSSGYVDYAPYVAPMAWTMLPLCCSVVAVLWFGLCGDSMCLPMLASIIHLWATMRGILFPVTSSLSLALTCFHVPQ